MIVIRGGSETAATSKMELFVIIVNGCHKVLYLGCYSSPRSAASGYFRNIICKISAGEFINVIFLVNLKDVVLENWILNLYFSTKGRLAPWKNCFRTISRTYQISLSEFAVFTFLSENVIFILIINSIRESELLTLYYLQYVEYIPL